MAKRQSKQQILDELSCQGCGLSPTRDKPVSSVQLSFGVAGNSRRGKPRVEVHKIADRLEAYFHVWWCGAAEVTQPYPNVNAIIEFFKTGSDLRDLGFCSTECLRDWFNRLVDLLESEREKLSKKQKDFTGSPLCSKIDNPNLRRPRRRSKAQR